MSDLNTRKKSQFSSKISHPASLLVRVVIDVNSENLVLHLLVLLLPLRLPHQIFLPPLRLLSEEGSRNIPSQSPGVHLQEHQAAAGHPETPQ